MQKHISRARRRAPVPVRVVIVTLDNHLASATERAERLLAEDIPGIELSLHAAATWAETPGALEACKRDISQADFIIANMLFMEDHIEAILPDLQARRDHCDAIVGCMAAGEIIRLTRLGKFQMNGSDKGLVALIKRLRGNKKKGQASGAKQMAMLRRLPRILKFIPGTAQDMRAYFLTLQYWLAGSDQNTANMVRLLVDRYASGKREHLRGTVHAKEPAEYPEVGVYHPSLTNRPGCISDDTADLPHTPNAKGTVGLLLMRSYVLASNTQHYDAVIAALEAQGLNVIPAFAAGLDARPAIEKFHADLAYYPKIDALVSLTGFSLVGGPAYNDANAAEDILKRLDIPYIAAHAIEFQNLEQWRSGTRGLTPVEATMMVAIPELDGATGPIVFGGRSDASDDGTPTRDMKPDLERANMLAERVTKQIGLRKTEKANRRLAIVLFNFPPNAGSTGTAAFLSVYASLFNTLKALKADGYNVDVPESIDALRDAILKGNAAQYGTPANVHAKISVDDHVRHEPHLAEIEAQWGAAPGKHQSNGRDIFVLGAEFGDVLVGVQPSFGYEGDPMRLLFERGFAPTHAFSAFYRYIRKDFGAHAVLHFGTHGALEFMPGKQVGLADTCWPDRLIADVPNYYLYAANNPSEGTIAKRRSAATLVSYLTPPVAHAGLYKGLLDLRASIERWRGAQPDELEDRGVLADLIQTQAHELELVEAGEAWSALDAAVVEDAIDTLASSILELEYTLIPDGLHIVGQPMSDHERADTLAACAEALTGMDVAPDRIAAIAMGEGNPTDDQETKLMDLNHKLKDETELGGLLRALDGRFVPPAPSGDLIRTPDLLPTGRNLHGFDPYRMPSAYAVADARQQADRLLARHAEDGNPLPRSMAIVLWGSDNIKSEGGPIAQALALMGAEPRFDSYGRLCGANLIPLESLGRPRIDVMMTLSGIFRDLLPLQTRMLAEAALAAAKADEPVEQNFIRAHTLQYMEEHDCDLESAALRVFSNADGAYGANVNHMIEDGAWQDEDELAETYMRRKCFAYGCDGQPRQQSKLLKSMLSNVSMAYQNLESVELGVTTVDHYFDSLGGITRAVKRSGGEDISVYIGDQTRGKGLVRTLSEQVALESRTRMLNPKWYEGMLKHGYEGVRQIEAHVTNTMGWSATTGEVQPWVYSQITETFLLDPEMRKRLAELNPTASAKVANRLLEAHERQYWSPDEETLEALRKAEEELEDHLECGGGVEVAA